MKMKLALASALAFHPRLIVLDEPFGGLDPLVRDQLIEPQDNVCTDNAENGKIAHAFVQLNSFEFPRPILNLAIEYSISFDQSRRSTDTPDVVSPNQNWVRLCPGAEIRLGRPEEQKKVRVQFDLPEVRLQDLAEFEPQ
jgi:hypothetical protein